MKAEAETLDRTAYVGEPSRRAFRWKREHRSIRKAIGTGSDVALQVSWISGAAIQKLLSNELAWISAVIFFVL
jgi:hypothetical protein